MRSFGSLKWEGMLRPPELIAEAALARFLNASAWEMGTNVHPHPSLSEVVGEAAQLSAGISIYW